MDDIIIGFIYFKGTPKLLGNHNYFGEKLINILDFYIAYDYRMYYRKKLFDYVI